MDIDFLGVGGTSALRANGLSECGERTACPFDPHKRLLCSCVAERGVMRVRYGRFNLNSSAGNMMSETNTFQADSGSTDEPARKADVMPTASVQIAQWLARDEANAAHYRTTELTLYGQVVLEFYEDNVRRLRAITESINAGNV